MRRFSHPVTVYRDNTVLYSILFYYNTRTPSTLQYSSTYTHTLVYICIVLIRTRLIDAGENDL